MWHHVCRGKGRVGETMVFVWQHVCRGRGRAGHGRAVAAVSVMKDFSRPTTKEVRKVSQSAQLARAGLSQR